jgi:hypothetical protein
MLAAPMTSGGPTRPPEPPKPSPGIVAAEADLRPNEIQNLADHIGELIRLATTAGVDLRFHLRVELGDGCEIPADVRTRVSKLLESVKSGFTCAKLGTQIFTAENRRTASMTAIWRNDGSGWSCLHARGSARRSKPRVNIR